MRVHVVSRPAPPDERVLRAALRAPLALSWGPQPDPLAEVLVAGELSAELLAGPRLTAVIVPWAGLSRTALDALRGRPGLAAYNLHFNAAATAEMAIALLLAAAKSIVPADRRLREGDWSMRGRGEHAVELAGRTALVLGLGAIGRRVARACQGLDMRVAGISRHGRPVEGVEVFTPEHLRLGLARADALLVCLPATAETAGLLGRAELALLAPHAVLVNVARGAIIDAQALYEALAAGRLFAAGLDVWWRYPRGPGRQRPADPPFERLPQVVMSPHRGGHVREVETQRMRALAATLDALRDGSPPPPVDLALGY